MSPIERSGGGRGTVTSVTATDASIVIGGTATDPTVGTGTVRGVTLLGPTNTTGETSLASLSVPANALGTSKTARFIDYGDWIQNTGAIRNTPRFRFFFGGTLLIDTGAGAAGIVASANRFPWRVFAEVTNTGATNAQAVSFGLDILCASSAFGGAALTTGEGRWFVDTTSSGLFVRGFTTATVDTTAACLVQLNVILPTATATIDLKGYASTVEIV